MATPAFSRGRPGRQLRPVGALAALATALLLVATIAGAGDGAEAARATRTQPVGVRTGSPATADPAAPRRTTAERSSGTLTLDWGDLDATPDAWKGSYVVMQPWEYARIPALKARNPGLKVLMYKDVSATVRDACPDTACTRDDPILPTGVGYHWALDHHPGWFLRDASGRPIEWSDWPGLFPMDVGRRGYQDTWAGNVLTELRAHDWDGVMLDDALTTLSHTTFGDRVSPQIPTDAAMYAATDAFLARVGPRLTGAGFAAVANVAFQWDDWRSVLSDWTPYVSGWEDEYFVKWGLGPESRFAGADWRWKMQLSAWCARRSVPLLAVTYSAADDTAAQLYHRATFLLTWNGRTGASIFVPQEDSTDHWLPRATVEIGRPDGVRRVVAAGVRRRDYTHGTVLVNPTTTARTVRVGAGYRTLAGRSVTTVRLAPATAAILRR